MQPTLYPLLAIAGLTASGVLYALFRAQQLGRLYPAPNRAQIRFSRYFATAVLLFAVALVAPLVFFDFPAWVTQWHWVAVGAAIVGVMLACLLWAEWRLKTLAHRAM